ncbi:MAG: hypothetical protein KAI24_25230, partial [Planctomycetes bacterium]|nr:hypothetical protein [Planctomycetota bacterium]
MTSRLLRMSVVALLFAVVVSAQVRDQREATVGMRAYIEQVVLEGSELIAAPTSIQAPLLVRILQTWPHGDHLRYDFEWVGFEEGTFDLTDYLVRKDGSSTDGLPAVEVEVVSVLPGDVFEPNELEPTPGERLDGYSTLQVAVTAIWVAGLLAILFVGRKFRKKQAPPPPKPTLADRLRPLVEQVAAGDADVEG